MQTGTDMHRTKERLTNSHSYHHLIDVVHQTTGSLRLKQAILINGGKKNDRKFTFTERNWEMVGAQARIAFDTNKQWRSSTTGNQLPGEFARLEGQSKSTLLKARH